MFAAATHPVLSGSAIERINKSNLKKIVVTDTMPMNVKSPKIEVETIEQLFGEAIKRTFKHQSNSSLFDIDKG